ncbi:hypothetical protein [Lunatibacter salilacus]|uniref:hypothetical protein n=1 Tax=Lunatibacter salilacus TaxID=2483804 RepID=UPI00131CB5CD|nr:hypothetical protein [Lunatibacter salilacus]
MKTIFKGLLVIFCLSIGFNANSQNLFNVELYGGLNKNYFQTGEPTANPDLRFSGPLGQHAGINFLPSIGQNWQMSIQTEWMRSAIRLENADFNSSNRYNSYGNYALGARYNIDKITHVFYFQPAFGISINNYLEPMEGAFGAYSKRDIHFTARAEVGAKIYNKNRNYLLLGLRHQQGFGSGNPYGSEQWTDIPISGNASYTGMFIGYGINTDNWFKRSMVKIPKPEIENPWSDGIYAIASGSLRHVIDPVYDPTDDFQKVSTSYMVGLGYRQGDFSVESGFSHFRARNVHELLSPEGISVTVSHRTFAVSTVPVTLRYDRQLPTNGKIRLGASFTSHIPVGYRNSGADFINSAGSRFVDGVEYPFESQRTGFASNSRRVFFNSGLYTEMALFRTGMITFKASRNYGSPTFDRVQVDYQVSGVPDSFETKGDLNGWLFEVEYRLPLNHIF